MPLLRLLESVLAHRGHSDMLNQCLLLRGKADMDSGGILRGCMPDGSPVDPNHPWYKG
jgi:hypothetical protein